jgi:hypothetical protein
MWPFSRTAVLIPLSWWTMYLINKWHVSRPIFGLIDEVAEKAGFYPVYPKQQQQTEPAQSPRPAPSVPPAAEVLPDNPSIAAAK